MKIRELKGARRVYSVRGSSFTWRSQRALMLYSPGEPQYGRRLHLGFRPVRRVRVLNEN
jgi:hypothetical protein